MKNCEYCGRENADETVHCHECGTLFKTPVAIPEPPPVPTALPRSAEPALKFRELTPEDMKMDFVTLLTCRTLIEADLIVGQLDGAGIEAFVPDEFLSQTISWNLNTYGYVRIQVSPKDYESAKRFLLAAPGDMKNTATGDSLATPHSNLEAPKPPSSS
jgi:hypothetical protein